MRRWARVHRSVPGVASGARRHLVKSQSAVLELTKLSPVCQRVRACNRVRTRSTMQRCRYRFERCGTGSENLRPRMDHRRPIPGGHKLGRQTTSANACSHPGYALLHRRKPPAPTRGRRVHGHTPSPPAQKYFKTGSVRTMSLMVPIRAIRAFAGRGWVPMMAGCRTDGPDLVSLGILGCPAGQPNAAGSELEQRRLSRECSHQRDGRVGFSLGGRTGRLTHPIPHIAGDS